MSVSGGGGWSRVKLDLRVEGSSLAPVRYLDVLVGHPIHRNELDLLLNAAQDGC